MESIPDGGRSSLGDDTAAVRSETAAQGREPDGPSQTLEQRDRLEGALEAAGLAAFEWEPRTDAFAGSRALALLLGAEPAYAPRALAEMLARVHVEDRGALEREMRDAVAARRSLHAHARAAQGAHARQGEGAGRDATAGGAGSAGLRWLRWRASVFCDEAGEVDRMIGLVEDVTREKQAEAEHRALVRRERALRTAAEQANRSKDEFLSMFSHELRSPLNAILGWNRILAVKRAADEEARR